LTLLLGGVFLAAVAVGWWLAVDLAERSEERAARPQVRLVSGVVGLYELPALTPARLQRFSEQLGVGLAAVAEDGAVLAHSWPDATDTAALAAVRPVANRLAAVRLAGARYRVGFVAVPASQGVVDPRSPGGAERVGPRPAWMAVAVPETGAAQRVGTTVLSVTIVGALVACCIAWFLLAPVVGRVRRLAAAAGEVARGDLEREVPPGGGDEVGRLAEAFRDMLNGLRETRAKLVQAERLAALGQISTAVAHEIRNPLAAIRMTVQLLRESASDDRAREDCELLMREASRLELFLDDLLAWGRPDPGVREPVDVAAVIADVCDLEAARADHLGVRLEREIAPDLPAASGDKRRLTQVCANLVLNAIQAVGSGGSVTVRAAAGPAGLVIDVRDSGAGVPDEVAAQLFTPFVTSKPNGTGLGLALSRRIAGEHGGALAYLREEGATVFRLTLPAAAAPAPASTPSAT
jgi:signal transduction histidine kinase